MPISNDVTVKPSTGGGGGGDIVPEGVYPVEIADMTYISGEENQFSDRPQLKFRFKILGTKQKDLELVSWISMTINPGWEQGSPSNLYKIATAVMGEEVDMAKEFYPNTLLGGKLQVVVESKKGRTGNEISRISNYLKAVDSVPAPKKVASPEDAGIDESLVESATDGDLF